MSKKIAVLSFLLIAMVGVSVAQNSAIETVAIRLKQDTLVHADNQLCIQQIEKAKENPSTANAAKMWYYRGRFYLRLYLSNDEQSKEQVGDALDRAYESLIKVKDGEKANRYNDDAQPFIIRTGFVLNNAAYIAYTQSNFDESLRRYRQLFDILPYDKDGTLKRNNIVQDKLYESYYLVAQTAGKYDTAKKYINLLINDNYMSPNLYVNLANIHVAQGDTSAALDALAAGKEMFEDNMDIILTELDLSLKLGRTQALIEQSNRAIEQDPTNRLYYFIRGVSYDKLGHQDSAIMDYEKAIELDPYYYDAYYNLGAIYINQTEDLIKKMNNTQKQDEIDKLDLEINGLYKKGLPYFEKALEISEDPQEQLALAGTMRQLYAKLSVSDPSYMDKYKKIKAFMEQLEAQQ